jgi:hypothetical protein
MKTGFLVIIGTICIAFCSCAQNATDKIWGVWNIGDDAVLNASISLGYYARTGDFLEFEPDPKVTGAKYFGGDGYGYSINKIISKNGAFYLTVSYSAPTAPHEKQDYVKVTGIIVMHFIDNDHMWLEVDYKDPQPDPLFHKYFPEGDFQGKHKIYWRAKKLAKPLPDTEE